MIRELVTVDRTFGSGLSQFKHVWVVDAPMSGVGRPGAGESRGQAFSAAFKAELRRELTDLGALDFVGDGDEVRDLDSDPQVRDHGDPNPQPLHHRHLSCRIAPDGGLPTPELMRTVVADRGRPRSRR